MKVGIEIEFWVIDDKGRLDLAKPISERVYFASQEFSKSMIEIQTEPHEQLDQLFKEAISKTEILTELAKKDGKRITPLGTPLNSRKPKIFNSNRYKIEKEVIGSEVKKAGRTAGLHIHFEKNDVKNQLNTLTAIDPFLSLVNSSPSYQGKRIGKGSRNLVYRNQACGKFPDQRQLWPYVKSVAEWQEKRSKLYQKFKEEAMAKKVNQEDFERHFQPENSVWTPVKLREDYPTVEWRSPDTTLPTEIIKLVREVKPIVESEDTELPEFKKVKSASKKAMKKGLDSKEVRKYIKKFGVNTSKFNPISETINSSQKMNKKIARIERLNTADQLEKDLENAKQMI